MRKENPYSAPDYKNESAETSKNNMQLLGLLLKYFGAYILGIVVCILVTPVSPTLIGKPLWPLYPLLAPIGFLLYYLYLSTAYLPFGDGITYWLFSSIGFIPIIAEVIAYVAKSPSLNSLRPVWIGLPVGFIGTLGVFYTAAASI